MATPKVSGVREAKEILKRIDPEGMKTLQRDFHKNMGSPLAKITKQAQINNRRLKQELPNMFNHRGRTRNTGADIKASFRPSASYGRSIALLTARGRNSQFGFEYAELAGINKSINGRRSRKPGSTTRGSRPGDGSYRLNGQGQAFNRILNRIAKPGRLSYDAAQDNRDELEKAALDVLGKMFKKLNEELRVNRGSGGIF